MARYRQGVNGSMQGSAGGVTVYTRCGVQIMSRKRKPPLTFKAAKGQEIVISNFTEMSKLMRPFRYAFRAVIKAPATVGQTYYSVGCSINYQLQKARHADAQGLINFDKSDIILGVQTLPSFVPILQHVDVDTYALIWTPPADPDKLRWGQVTIMYLSNEGEYTFTTRNINTGRLEFHVKFMMRSATDYLHVYFCPHSAHGIGSTSHYVVYPPAEVGETSA